MESRYRIIDLQAVAYNFSLIKSLVGTSLIMPIVKANAYGHGLQEIAKFLQDCGAHYMGVAAIEEALFLRKHNIYIPILVLGSFVETQIPLFLQNNIECMAASKEKLDALNRYAQEFKIKAKVHLKLDTGLSRLGVRSSNAEQFFLHALSLKHIEVVGIASHFATADSPDRTFMHEQTERFYQACLLFEKYAGRMPLRHIANSAALVQSKDTHFDMVRPGIMCYGVYPASWMRNVIDLKPVMSLYARVVYFKVVLAGIGVSYGLTWRSAKDTRVITVSVGYGDGYPRALTNKGYVLLKGNHYPIVGAVCMDQMMIDIGQASAYNGDEVVIIGKSGTQEITVNDLVDLYGGSPYEFLTMQTERISRYYLK
jgi:alanine racemase